MIGAGSPRCRMNFLAPINRGGESVARPFQQTRVQEAPFFSVCFSVCFEDVTVLGPLAEPHTGTDGEPLPGRNTTVAGAARLPPPTEPTPARALRFGLQRNALYPWPGLNTRTTAISNPFQFPFPPFLTGGGVLPTKSGGNP